VSTLRYPLDIDVKDEYMIFTPYEYRTNIQTASRGSGPPIGNQIILYMPSNLPATANDNGWKSSGDQFAGALGLMKAGLFQGLGDVATNTPPDSKGFIQDIMARFGTNNPGRFGGSAAVQGGLNVTAGAFNTSPNTILNLSRNPSIYNPNVELLYQGPNLRGFNVSFVMNAKSGPEAERINEIIKDFKKNSAPAQEGGMYRVPHVYDVTYMKGSQKNTALNEFKRSALTNIQVQNNPGMDTYMSFRSGHPISVGLSLTFMEVDVILREDHEESEFQQGF
jgi:hypothetical protein